MYWVTLRAEETGMSSHVSLFCSDPCPFLVFSHIAPHTRANLCCKDGHQRKPTALRTGALRTALAETLLIQDPHIPCGCLCFLSLEPVSHEEGNLYPDLVREQKPPMSYNVESKVMEGTDHDRHPPSSKHFYTGHPTWSCQ